MKTIIIEKDGYIIRGYVRDHEYDKENQKILPLEHPEIKIKIFDYLDGLVVASENVYIINELSKIENHINFYIQEIHINDNNTMTITIYLINEEKNIITFDISDLLSPIFISCETIDK